MALRVLHVLAGLGQGGIEKWLVNLAAEFQRQSHGEVQNDFLTLISRDGYYQKAIEAMACKVHHCQLVWKKLPGFVLQVAAILRQGRYDVVHCHADYLSGLVLPVARAAGVPARIGHVHATQFAFQARRPRLRHAAGRLLRRLQIWDGGVCVGTSPAALDAYLGEWKSRIRHEVCMCGVPCAEYRAAVQADRAAVRQTLGWPQDDKILLHVGRHAESKNLFFLLDVFGEVLRREPAARCVLAGSGELTATLQQRAAAAGLAQQVRFLGSRDDVPQLMRAADLLLLPSANEGLGLVVVEAQAVGLRALVSQAVPGEAEVVPQLVHRLALTEPAERWAERAEQLLRLPPSDPRQGLQGLEASPFNIAHSAQALMAIYRGAL